MDLQIRSKTAFISGSTQGIGFAIAEALAKEGATVIINGRKQESIDEAIDKMKKDQIDVSKVSGISCDFAKPEDVEKLIPKLKDVDILVNNVGIFKNQEFTEISDADWERFFQVNVMSGVRLSRALFPEMKKKDWGRIIFISSESGFNIPKEMVHYGVTKTAILALSRGLAKQTTGTGITANSVLPGPTKTEGNLKNVPEDMSFDEYQKQFFEDARPTSILKRFAKPEEVANLVAYIASPLSSATNGASLRVDGGIVDTI